MAEKVIVLYGKNKFLLNKKLKELVENTKVEEFNINSYSLLDNDINEIIEDLITISFFSEEKVVIVRDLDELLKLEERLVNRFIDYLKKPNPDVYLFIVLDELINKNYPLGKAISRYSYINEVTELKENEFNDYLINYLNEQGYSIENKAVSLLIERTKFNLDLLMQEIDKLTSYKIDTKLITYEDVVNLVSESLEENIYEIINSLFSKETKKTVQIFYDLLEQNEDPIRIMNSISNRLRQMIQTKILLESNSSQNQIAEHLNISPNQAYYVMRDARKLVFSDLENMIERLSDLDYNIKSGKIDKTIGLEMFLLAN